MNSIKWTRPQDGLYVSACGTYEIARTLGSGSTAISEPGWVAYVKRADGWKRITDRRGAGKLARAKSICQAHADTAEVAA